MRILRSKKQRANDAGGNHGGGEVAELRGGEALIKSAGSKGSDLSCNWSSTGSRNSTTTEQNDHHDDEPWGWNRDAQRAADARIAALVILSSLEASRVRTAQEEDRRRLMASRGRGRGPRLRRSWASCRDRESTPHPYPRLGGFASPRGASKVSSDWASERLGEPRYEEEKEEDEGDYEAIPEKTTSAKTGLRKAWFYDFLQHVFPPRIAEKNIQLVMRKSVLSHSQN
ncbi:hypothetical protein QBC42DRAFT_1426 [Cladorrhinum samala]|uniref:Uncharacterized protein n=1 Tax=Cladorrhinum samala TaxID=585594 RepID=A0AAV9I683_9PEZI|nr:hypothetical protein QBC42DRAFT_1426 [Cladorrhinum samala]